MFNLQAIMRKGINNSINQFEQLGYVGNNLANLNTSGYKSVRFEQMMHEDGYVSGIVRTDHKVGSTKVTSNPYDVSITEAGYIPVVSADGQVAYTRDGAFKKGKDGYLMTSDDWIVGEGIKLPANCYKFDIESNGDVMVYDVAGSKARKMGNIPLVRFACPEGLEDSNYNKVVPTEESGQPELVKDHDTFAQFTLENSNTSMYSSVNEMLRLNASMLASMRMIQVVDDMYNKSINIRE
ncbi:MAG: flagellar hook basal-body protein [Candidatus Gastranaerophilales bacterium]